jgi:hypothetical protein
MRLAMAKKKAKPKPKPSLERLSVLNLKGSPEYREWLSEISYESRIAVSVIVRDAVAKWAEERGYSQPPDV